MVFWKEILNKLLKIFTLSFVTKQCYAGWKYVHLRCTLEDNMLKFVLSLQNILIIL